MTDLAKNDQSVYRVVNLNNLQGDAMPTIIETAAGRTAKVVFAISDEDFAALEQLATEDRRKVNDMARKVLLEWIDANRPAKKRARR